MQIRVSVWRRSRTWTDSSGRSHPLAREQWVNNRHYDYSVKPAVVAAFQLLASKYSYGHC